MKNEFTFTGLVNVVRRNFKTLAILTVIAAVVGAVFSGPAFIKPKFKSEAVVYPVNIFPYSVESETEQMMQVFQASEIRDSIIEKFDLYSHWEIDRNDKKARYKILKEWDDNVSVRRTNYESGVITVMDYSPDTAKMIVDEIIKQFNLTAAYLAHNKSMEYYKMAVSALKQRKQTIDSVAVILDSLRKQKNILDYEVQTQEVTKGYYRMLSAGYSGKKLDEAKDLLDNLKAYGGQFYELSSAMEVYLEDYGDWMVKRDNFYTDATKKLTYLNIVEFPEVPVKKSYPVRWVIVLSVIMATLLMAIVLLSIFQKDNF